MRPFISRSSLILLSALILTLICLTLSVFSLQSLMTWFNLLDVSNQNIVRNSILGLQIPLFLLLLKNLRQHRASE